MLLTRLFAVALAVPAPSPASPRTLGVLPLQVEGELPGSLQQELRQRIAEGARRGPVTVVEIADAPVDCITPLCLSEVASNNDSDYLLVTRLAVSDGQRRYAFEGRVLDAQGRELLATEAGCEVCGFAEAAERIEDAVAVAAKTIDRPETERAAVELRGGPAGATLSIDGAPAGELPLVRELPPGSHTITISMPGFVSQTLQVELQAGTRKIVDIELKRAPPPPPDRRPARAMVATGAALLGVSVAAIATGAVFVGLDGEPYRGECEADREGNCRRLWATGGLGAGLLAGGVVLLVTGVTLLAVGKRRQSKAEARRQFSPVRAWTSAMRSAALLDPSFAAMR